MVEQHHDTVMAVGSSPTGATNNVPNEHIGQICRWWWKGRHTALMAAPWRAGSSPAQQPLHHRLRF